MSFHLPEIKVHPEAHAHVEKHLPTHIKKSKAERKAEHKIKKSKAHAESEYEGLSPELIAELKSKPYGGAGEVTPPKITPTLKSAPAKKPVHRRTAVGHDSKRLSEAMAKVAEIREKIMAGTYKPPAEL